MEPLCGTLKKPELLRMEPLGGTLWNLAEPGARFRAAAPNHPGALLEEPQAFQAVGEKGAGKCFCVLVNTKATKDQIRFQIFFWPTFRREGRTILYGI